ncbi:alkaline shock response membrane anchor protein AmaP [Actinomadura sp. ATCC 31491]|uniref:Alkaline shock response membrane anchor protein AmaP n=1 Tax=Actinomadura luzonensis TaxID=2805427 RepID=A0ABT0FKA2_9ACTN|nr:alkaline shock response membrane anchor protein AmaP [Actinomadura luzonensis]MCK2212741.1 alkaline shock response membrane anchor protein AmaP [Actinomadura luzonensis]
MSRRTGRVNRWALALTGLVLAALGGTALARGLGAFGQDPRAPIVSGEVRAFFARAGSGIWWAVALASIVLVLLALRWLFAQGRGEVPGVLRLDDGPDGVTEVSAGGVAQAVAADVEASPAVLSAHAGLVRSRGGPEVRLTVVADEAAPMSEVAGHLSGVALPHMRDALDRDQVPAVARVSLEPSPAPHRVVH